MKTVTSKDGTTIAFDKVGAGPALILVPGAIQHRAIDPKTEQLMALLAEQFTTFNYDRRGRGDSGDTQPYAVEREIEDIEALVDEAGGSAFLYGISSGAALAMEATLALGDKVKKLALYEVPYNADETARQAWRNYRTELQEVLASGRPGDAMLLFMMLLGLAAEQAPAMRQSPMWPAFESIEHTLAYDAAVLGEEADIPIERAARLTVPTLVMDGGATEFPFMHITALALTQAIPHAQHRTLEGQTHEVDSAVLAPALAGFFAG